MSIPLTSGTYQAADADLSRSEFRDVNLSEAVFDDVSLHGASFRNIALTGATFRNVCFGDVSIAEASYTGMRIEGILVTELLRVYREREGA
jgi:uncharacterized protein YjbI with pentapeptide repeats